VGRADDHGSAITTGEGTGPARSPWSHGSPASARVRSSDGWQPEPGLGHAAGIRPGQDGASLRWFGVALPARRLSPGRWAGRVVLRTVVVPTCPVHPDGRAPARRPLAQPSRVSPRV